MLKTLIVLLATVLLNHQPVACIPSNNIIWKHRGQITNNLVKYCFTVTAKYKDNIMKNASDCSG